MAGQKIMSCFRRGSVTDSPLGELGTLLMELFYNFPDVLSDSWWLFLVDLWTWVLLNRRMWVCVMFYFIYFFCWDICVLVAFDIPLSSDLVFNCRFEDNFRY